MSHGRPSGEIRRILQRKAAKGHDWAAMMLDVDGRPARPPEELGAQVAEEDRLTNTLPEEDPRSWVVTRRLALRDHDDFRVKVNIEAGVLLRYEHRHFAQVFHDWDTTTGSVLHRFKVLDGGEAGRVVTYLETWSSADDGSDRSYDHPFPPDGLEPG